QFRIQGALNSRADQIRVGGDPPNDVPNDCACANHTNGNAGDEHQKQEQPGFEVFHGVNWPRTAIAQRLQPGSSKGSWSCWRKNKTPQPGTDRSPALPPRPVGETTTPACQRQKRAPARGTRAEWRGQHGRRSPPAV